MSPRSMRLPARPPAGRQRRHAPDRAQVEAQRVEAGLDREVDLGLLGRIGAGLARRLGGGLDLLPLARGEATVGTDDVDALLLQVLVKLLDLLFGDLDLVQGRSDLLEGQEPPVLALHDELA
jgi:hypothetical protein